MTDVRNKIVTIIYSVTKPDRPNLSDHSVSLLAGAVDSLDYASILMALEDEFGVVLLDENVEELVSIDQLTDYIEAQRKT